MYITATVCIIESYLEEYKYKLLWHTNFNKNSKLNKEVQNLNSCIECRLHVMAPIPSSRHSIAQLRDFLCSQHNRHSANILLQSSSGFGPRNWEDIHACHTYTDTSIRCSTMNYLTSSMHLSQQEAQEAEHTLRVNPRQS